MSFSAFIVVIYSCWTNKFKFRSLFGNARFLYLLSIFLASSGNIFDLVSFHDPPAETTFSNRENDGKIQAGQNSGHSQEIILSENNVGLGSPRGSSADIESVIEIDQLAVNVNVAKYC